MLSPLHPDQGDQLQLHLYLSGTESAAQGEPGDSVRQLRMPRLLEQRLRFILPSTCSFGFEGGSSIRQKGGE
jgi:hypothetical protein